MRLMLVSQGEVRCDQVPFSLFSLAHAPVAEREREKEREG